MPHGTGPAAKLVLVADGSDESRRAYAEHLRALAYEVDEAEDGPEALGKLIVHRPAAVVINTGLAMISGHELSRMIRHDPSIAATPIVAMAGNRSPDDVRLAKLAGADCVLVTPCPADVLSDQIRRAIAARARYGRHAAEDGAVHLRPYGGHPAVEKPAGSNDIPGCPGCRGSLKYIRSHFYVGQRNHEQWDYFDCRGCLRTFERRRRTQRLRLCSPRLPHLS